jgi:hypothetical protein
MADDRQVIDLDAPQDGIVPDAGANLHEDELRRVVYRIRDRALEAKAAARGQRRAGLEDGDDEADNGDRRDRRRAAGCDDDCLPRIDHSRRGILIDAERGVGKTTFLRSICATVNDYRRFEREPGVDGAPKPRVVVRVLPLLDPTLIDGDRVFLATVIANLLEVVERARGRKDVCDRDGRAKEQRFNAALASMHAGLAASADAAWHKLTAEGSPDSRFIDQLLSLARGGISMADRFECFVRAAADLLDVDMFVQPIDDVDVAQAEAWTTLEVVRRYLSGPTLLPVVAGSLSQLEGRVRHQFIKDELPALKQANDLHPRPAWSQSLVELEDQGFKYLHKLFATRDREHLSTKRDQLLDSGFVTAVEGGKWTTLPIYKGGVYEAAKYTRENCLVGRAEGALFPSASAVVTGAAAELMPDDTRRLIASLRVLRALSAVPAPSLNERRRLLHLLVDIHADAVAAAGLQVRDLAALIRSGVEATSAGLLLAAWPDLRAPRRAIRPRPDPVARLVQIALTDHLLEVSLGPLSLMTEVWRPVAVVAALREQGALPTDAAAVQVLHGLLRVKERAEDPAAAATIIERSHEGGVHTTRELSIAPREAQRQGRTIDGDAAVVMLLFGTRAPASMGSGWIVDPARGLSAVSRLLRYSYRIDLEQPDESNPKGLQPDRVRLFLFEIMAAHRRSDTTSVLVQGRTSTSSQDNEPWHLRAIGELPVPSDSLAKAIGAWVEQLRKPKAVFETGQEPSLWDSALLAEVSYRWHQHLAETCSEARREVGLGQLLQESVLGLFASFIVAESGRPTPSSTGPTDDNARAHWLLASTRLRNAAPGFRHLDTLSQALQAICTCNAADQPASENGAASGLPWHRRALPCTAIIATCPVLRATLTGDWEKLLQGAFPVPEPQESEQGSTAEAEKPAKKPAEVRPYDLLQTTRLTTQTKARSP